MPSSTPDTGRLRPVLIGLGVLALFALGALFVGRMLEQSRERSRFEAVQTRLGDLRQNSENCRRMLARAEDAFQGFGRQVDSLRSAVRAYEDDGRVPEAVYEEYLDLFDRYNESIPVWEVQADSLRVIQARCRATIEAHNRLADSVRAVVEERER